MFGTWGVGANSGCPNCGHRPYKKKDPCEKCNYLESDDKKLADAWFIFCNDCGCHYMSEDGGCPSHGHKSVKKVTISNPNPTP